MPFASALSEHPVAALATGEVTGAGGPGRGAPAGHPVVTTTHAHAGALEDIVTTVTAVLHPLVVIGCASEAVVGTGRQVEGTAAINLWAARVGPLAPLALTATQLTEDSWHFAGWPEPLPFTPSALVLVVDAPTFPVEPFLHWLHARHPEIPVIGGASSGGPGVGGSRLIVGNRLVSAGATGVLLGGGVDVETVVSQGARPYGQALTVTRAERNLIYEVAGTPAMECLVQQIGDHLGVHDVSRLGTDGVLIGRLMHEGVDQPGPGDYLVRAVLGVDRRSGAIAVRDRVPVGSTIRFHLRDGRSADTELMALLDGRNADGALLFPCNARGAQLFGIPHHDVLALREAVGAVPVGGFAAAGEIGPVGGQNFLHSHSASLSLFRDR